MDIDQICKTQKKAEEDAVKRIEDTPNPRVGVICDSLMYGSLAARDLRGYLGGGGDTTDANGHGA